MHKNSFFIAASLAAFSLVPARAQSTPAPAFRADAFTDFVAINGAPIKTRIHDEGPFKGAGKTFDPQVFYDLGIRHYRMALKYDLTLPDQPQQVEAAYRKSGAQALMLIDPGKEKPEEVLGLVKQYAPGSIGGIEGPNELNNKFPPQDLNMKYAEKTDEAAGSAYMDVVYQSLKNDAATKNIPVVSFTSIFSDYRLAHPHAAFDFANMHSYQGYDVPSASLLPNETRFNNIYPTGATIKPFVPTECGYNVEADAANGTFKTGSLCAQALGIPMLLAEYFRHGIKRTYLFAIENADGYGLLESDLTTKRPSYFALKNFLAQIKDATWNPKTLKWEGGDNFAPRALMFDLQNTPTTIHTITLQKKSGEWVLMIWNEVPIFDQNAKKDIENAPVPVALKLSTRVANGAQILTQNADGSYDTKTTKIENGILNLAVPSSVMLVKLRPAGGARTDNTPPETPTGLKGTATENRINFRWKPVAVSDLAGYFVFRNDALVATTKATQLEDASTWIRPSLGYRYAVQAFDTSGNLSPRAQLVIQTPDKRPDLVISDVQIPIVKEGEAIRFKATLKNNGDGATPNDTMTGLTFYVDGQFTSWATTAVKSIAPDESIAMEAFGGPSAAWKATPGAHVLRVQADDINRIPGERNEFNNDADRSFFVGDATAGVLQGQSDAAPFAFDVTKEGTLDWAVWGANGKESVTRKANGGALISEMGKVGDGYRDATTGAGVRLSWSDGDAEMAKSDGTNAGFWLNGVGHGFEFSVPADTTEKTLKVIVGGIEGARGKFVAHLSDNSAPDYVSQTWNGNAAFNWAPVPGSFNAIYTLRFKAATPNQKLTIQWILDGEPNRFLGQARLQATAISQR